jgi:hypothetical protein
LAKFIGPLKIAPVELISAFKFEDANLQAQKPRDFNPWVVAGFSFNGSVRQALV